MSNSLVTKTLKSRIQVYEMKYILIKTPGIDERIRRFTNIMCTIVET